MGCGIVASVSVVLRMRGYHGDEGAESALVSAARTNPDAFGELYERYEARIYRYLRIRTGNADDAADLTQQVFLRVLEAFPRYEERGIPFRAWLFRIARNTATDHHRRRRETVTWDLVPEALQPAAEGQEPEATMLHREDLDRLRALLAELDPERRELITLRFVGKLTQAEIGTVVGKSEEAVRKQLARTLQGLRERYREQG
jgi:RNA polymerase sigma-70 factor (ECF subfamily)